jgi:cytochrome c-type biogenesis protein CcmH/NrfF
VTRLRRRHGSRRTLAAITACFVAVAMPATATAASHPSLLGIESQVMCVSCHEPLELVSSPQAQQEKAFIQRLIARGYTTKQIFASLVANFGTQVLGKPPASGFNLLVYILPPAILVAGLGGLLYTLPRWRARSRRAAATPLPGAPPLKQDESSRLDDELARFI